VKRKTHIIFSILIFTLSLIDSVLPQEKEPVIISPLVGDKLDRVERDYFKLFPRIEGFQTAVFYLNPDSSLMVQIKYLANDIIKDTIINEYKSLKKMQYHFINFIKHTMNNVEEDDKGRFVKISKNYTGNIAGELITVRDSSFLIYNVEFESQTEQSINSYGLVNLNYYDVKNVRISDETNIGIYIYPTLGSLVGALIASAVKEEEPSPQNDKFEINISIPTSIIIGSLLGGLVGVILSGIVPFEIVSENVFESPFTENDIKGLNDNARYSEGTPYYLQKLE
jgi:hypothetical protein